MTTLTAPVVLDIGEDVEAPTSGLAHVLLSAEDEVSLSMRIEAGLCAAHVLDLRTTAGVVRGKGSTATIEELEWLAADGVEARRAFIEKNLRLAVSTARKFRTRGFTEEDVRQDAYQGLVKAVDRFDHRLGYKFSTYAVWWIRESILTGIRFSGFVKHPEALWNQMMKVRAVRLQIMDETGDRATPAQIAVAAKMTLRDVLRCLHTDISMTSLSAPVGEDITLGELVSDDEPEVALMAVEDRFDLSRLATLLGEALVSVEVADRAVLTARYGLDGQGPRTLTAVAAELGLNRQTVRVREQRALNQLLAASRDRLEPFRCLVE